MRTFRTFLQLDFFRGALGKVWKLSLVKTWVISGLLRFFRWLMWDKIVPCDGFLPEQLEDGRPHLRPLVLEGQLLALVLQHAGLLQCCGCCSALAVNARRRRTLGHKERSLSVRLP